MEASFLITIMSFIESLFEPEARHSVTPRWMLLVLILIWLGCLPLLCHVEREARGVWRVTALGLSITALRDTRTGPVLWVYTWGAYRGQWQQGGWHPAEPTPYPTQVPYPTSTPYPTATPKQQQSA